MNGKIMDKGEKARFGYVDMEWEREKGTEMPCLMAGLLFSILRPFSSRLLVHSGCPSVFVLIRDRDSIPIPYSRSRISKGSTQSKL